MACTENVLGGHSPSSTMVHVDNNRIREPRHSVPLHCPTSMLKDDEDDAETCGHPRVTLRPPFSMLRPRSRIRESTRSLRQPFIRTAAVEEESLAAAEVNSSDGLESQSQKRRDSINMSQEVSSSPMAMLVGGPRVSGGFIERGGNNTKPHVAPPRGQGFVQLRGPQTRGPPYVPTLRSGVMMEVTPGKARMAYQGNLARVSFPLGGPRHPMDNWHQRPLPLSTSIPGLNCSATHCFMPPQPPTFNPFPAIPTVFASPLGFGPPLLPYFLHYNSRAMQPAPYLN